MSVFELRAAAFRPHAVHVDTDWQEMNCYVDLWVELLSALGLEPLASLSFTLCSDFEFDQWTFFKPPHSDLRRLYGLQVEEISLWQSVLSHCEEQLAHGRIPLVEADSYYLPDTRATDYRQHHVKTTIAPTYLNRDTRTLRYFHNAGFYELEGEDFEALFRFDSREGREDDLSSGRARWLPPFFEIVKLDRVERQPVEQLARESLELARGHYAWRPRVNPISRFARAWPGHFTLLLEKGPETYHGYTFSMLRQCGANYAMLAEYLMWQERVAGGGLGVAAEPFRVISRGCKTMLLKLARAVYAKKPADFSELLGSMADAWDAGMSALEPALGKR